MGRGVDLEHETEGGLALAAATVLLGPSVSLGPDTLLTQDSAQRLAADVHLVVAP
jgi:hypothetical protein